jgi:hypothetical protein
VFPSKQIIVVYPDDYENLALAMQHEVAKVDGFDCTAWTIEHYKQNSPTLSGRSFVIFLGTAEENRFTKTYQSQISRIVNINGACHGWDGSKAIVFGDGSLDSKPAFEAFKSTLKVGGAAVGVSSVGTIGGVLGASFLGAVATTAAPVAILGGGIYSIAKYFKGKKSQKALRYEQTKMAIYNFLSAELEVWTKGFN